MWSCLEDIAEMSNGSECSSIFTNWCNFYHATPLLQELHYFQLVSFHAVFKLLVLIYKALYGLGPQSVADCLILQYVFLQNLSYPVGRPSFGPPFQLKLGLWGSRRGPSVLLPPSSGTSPQGGPLGSTVFFPGVNKDFSFSMGFWVGFIVFVSYQLFYSWL